jgi:hypothetical protein
VSVYASTWIYIILCEFIWISVNHNSFIRICTNLHECLNDCIWFGLISFDLFRICRNLYECRLNLFENMHTACCSDVHCWATGQPHIAARTCYRTLLHTAAHYRCAHCRTPARCRKNYHTLLLRALPHTATCAAAHICALPQKSARTAAHCRSLLHCRTTAANCRIAG